MQHKISVDAMGGDFGPPVTVPASLKILKKYENISIILVGDSDKITKILKKKKSLNHPRISVHPTTQVVGMDELPQTALKNKKDSSMRVSINLVKEGAADACVSAGNTGALMATARFVLRMLPGIDRPAISSELPSDNGTTCMLDLGANADCTPEQLLQFGIMGSILTNVLHKKNNPSIGLLSNGSESMKGSEVVKKSAELFRDSHLNFYGNVEGDDIFKGTTDVVVCDGFTGNISLKTTEGLAKMMANFLTLEFKRNWLTKISAIIALPVLKRFKKRLDPRRYNGASFLGLNGIVVKSHGGADEFAFIHALETTISESENDVISKIKDQLKVESII
ncbi:MAG: phosphate acyltransferase PlsX [Betaproteobacteria bacterium]|jgi:glycerol-3-phosphate acyltransferase PlsX|nr:phosphate acyltransferase PlsX [Betaproteobacteria bacterium]